METKTNTTQIKKNTAKAAAETSKKSTPKKLKKPVEKTAQETSKKAITQKIIVNKELKYIYPKGCIDTLARKSFRQKVRNAIRKMERELRDLKGETLKEAREKLQAYKDSVLVNPN